nr:NADH dehydrogenase subunit 5 [Crocidura batakorum]
MNYFLAFTMTTLFMLALPVMMAFLPVYKTNKYPFYVKTTISCAFFTSLIPALLFFNSGYEMIISNWHWMTLQTVKLALSFKLDYFSLLFMPVALFVTWSIVEFSMWYMHSDPNMNRFLKYLLAFLITMMILVTANNLFQLFIGWEGVGIMSFLLIGWWYGRTDANTAALQAILYNRIGDVGFILMMSWFMSHSNSWELHQIILTCTNQNNLPLLGLILAATGKSAQFGLHPWLPSAMEGPTPVSALLHSSTMVVAGVFLIIRFHPLIENNNLAKTLILSLGALTTLFAAICALTQNDIKKIVAFSTSSQLGLMMVTIGINQPHLAFLHICTHAFFKAMLFMCSGSIIHNLNDEQDIRKMGGLFKIMPFTTTSLIIGNLALTGTPFLTGFYSKDLIIETANTSYTNAWALMITLIATTLTAVYSTRMMFLVLLGQPRFNTLTLINENNPPLINPIKRLLIGSIFAGFLISLNLPPMTTPQMTMPMYLKLTALLITLMGFILALELSMLTQNLKLNMTKFYFNFSNMLGYFPITIHRFIPFASLLTSHTLASMVLDSTWTETSLPKLVSNIQKIYSTAVSSQKGLIKSYFLSFMFTLLISLSILNFPA